MTASAALTVAVTGPTGDIGKAFVRELERTAEVGRVLGMARRPFDPAAEGWAKTEYRQGDVLDRASVDALVDGADVVVHLAFIIFGSGEATRRINLEGSRNVFEAAIAAGVKRIVYTSSVAAYGFHTDHPNPITEDVPTRGSDHYYSAHKAELEEVLSALVEGTGVDLYVFRPCVVAGPTALAMVEEIPGWFRKAGGLRMVKPLVPDPGVPIQMVHEDDVATAMAAAVVGRGSPGAYNLAGEGTVTIGDVARAYGWRSFRIPAGSGRVAAEVVKRVPFMPAKARWVEAVKAPMLMDTTKARKELGWRPKHDAGETLRQTAEAARGRGLLP
jgi:UDP-glucose 4-epimerase